MASVLALPARGEVVLDSRGEGRALRISWHGDGELVVLSLWQSDTCSGTFRLAKEDVPRFVNALVSGLAADYHPPLGTRRAG